MSSNLVILPVCYLPPISWFQFAINGDQIKLENCENFVKQTNRNRCSIYGANGKLDLTIPVVHKGSTRAIQDMRIDDSQLWQKLHWKSLEAAYRSSPYFEYYEDDLKPFFDKKYDSLFNFNVGLLDKLIELLQIPLPYQFTDVYHHVYAEGRDYRAKFHPRTAIPHGDVAYQYIQVFSSRLGFIPDLSIVDLLFNEGPNAISIIKSTQ